MPDTDAPQAIPQSTSNQHGHVSALVFPKFAKLRDYFWFITVTGAAILVGIGVGILYFAVSFENQSPLLQKDFLVNVAAGFVGTGVGLPIAAVIGSCLAKNKLSQLSKPILALIQRLRIDGKIRPETARQSVVCAVTLLSESAVNSTIDATSFQVGPNCPICALEVYEDDKHCSFCHLPNSIWNDTELVRVDRENPQKTMMT